MTLHIIPDIDNPEVYKGLIQREGLRLEYNDFFVPKLLDNEDEVRQKIEFYKNNGLCHKEDTLHGPFFDICLFSFDSKIRTVSEERVEHSIRIAKALGSAAVIIHTNYIPTFVDDDYRRHWIEANESFIRKMRAGYPDVNIYMENMFDTEPYYLEELAKRLTDDEGFGVCLDYAHANVFGTCELREWIRCLAPHTRHLHINDNNLKRDEHLPLGMGSIDYNTFFNKYFGEFDDPSILLEVKGIEAIETSIAYLKTYGIRW